MLSLKNINKVQYTNRMFICMNEIDNRLLHYF